MNYENLIIKTISLLLLLTLRNVLFTAAINPITFYRAVLNSTLKYFIHWSWLHLEIRLFTLSSASYIKPNTKLIRHLKPYFIILIKDNIISQTGASQILVSKTSKKHLKWKIPNIVTAKILNYESLYWIIEFFRFFQHWSFCFKGLKKQGPVSLTVWVWVWVQFVEDVKYFFSSLCEAK